MTFAPIIGQCPVCHHDNTLAHVTANDTLLNALEENARLRAELAAEREVADKYRLVEARVERGCYALIFWDTDRDAWYKTELKDLT